MDEIEIAPRASAAEVEAAVIARLDALNWDRPKKTSVKAFRDGRAMLAERLRYLSPDQLESVAADAELLSRAVRGWPIPAMILDRAHRLFPDPDWDREKRRGIARWMRSAPGKAALTGDYAVEMLADLWAKGPGGVAIGAVTIDRWQRRAEDRRRLKRLSDDARQYWEAEEAKAAALVTGERGEA